ncbi:hypothetical protein [Oceanobacillus neutriphilus]|uniref:Uncharacterized protein n=1 Tax=Oceanobacillus neutriphilus TaxID=531815 RepID=A0ABQ2P2Z5_9BACI|nr:hypothetical protein [Oceanobacillus neutriphilus]GGP16895.1 hypothetical protein GCM10011346_50680 [Oceanobacillus neutriphilus]
MSLWKFLIIGIVIFIVIALPAFYFISGSLSWDILWRAALPFLIAILVVYFLISRR